MTKGELKDIIRECYYETVLSNDVSNFSTLCTEEYNFEATVGYLNEYVQIQEKFDIKSVANRLKELIQAVCKKIKDFISNILSKLANVTLDKIKLKSKTDGESVDIMMPAFDVCDSAHPNNVHKYGYDDSCLGGSIRKMTEDIEQFIGYNIDEFERLEAKISRFAYNSDKENEIENAVDEYINKYKDNKVKVEANPKSWISCSKSNFDRKERECKQMIKDDADYIRSRRNIMTREADRFRDLGRRASEYFEEDPNKTDKSFIKLVSFECNVLNKYISVLASICLHLSVYANRQ